MCGSVEPHPYPVRSFTYRNEQSSTNEVQRLIVYKIEENVLILNIVDIKKNRRQIVPVLLIRIF